MIYSRLQAGITIGRHYFIVCNTATGTLPVRGIVRRFASVFAFWAGGHSCLGSKRCWSGGVCCLIVRLLANIFLLEFTQNRPKALQRLTGTVLRKPFLVRFFLDSESKLCLCNCKQLIDMHMLPWDEVGIEIMPLLFTGSRSPLKSDILNSCFLYLQI